MDEQLENEDAQPQESAEQDVVTLIKKLQQQVTYLEKKIDLLINQSGARPQGDRSFAKPYRSFDRPRGNSDRAYGGSSGERSYAPARRFEKRHGEETRSFGHKRKPYEGARESEAGPARHFGRSHDGEKSGFEHKRKPFFHGRKDRE